MDAPFLKIDQLVKHFGDNKVLDGIDLTIGEASITTLVGKSGIGKSVLLKCLSGLLRPDSGSIELNGKRIPVLQTAGGDESEGAAFSYMFQSNALFDSMTVEENVALPLTERPGLSRKAIRERVREMLDKVELGQAAGRYPGEISGGMQKRVAFARALITRPRIVLFDEPTTGLDPERKFSVFRLIADQRDRFGFTAILVSHDIPEVFTISDHVALLDEGRIRIAGKPAEIENDLRESLAGLYHEALGNGAAKSLPNNAS